MAESCKIVRTSRRKAENTIAYKISRLVPTNSYWVTELELKQSLTKEKIKEMQEEKSFTNHDRVRIVRTAKRMKDGMICYKFCLFMPTYTWLSQSELEQEFTRDQVKEMLAEWELEERVTEEIQYLASKPDA